MSGLTAAGSYLAARHASQMRDAAAAAEFYRDALKRDPKNPDLLNRAFLSLVIGGNIEGSVKFAERVVRADKTDRVGRLVLGVHAIKEKHYRTARRDLTQSVRGPITDLTATLLTAWSIGDGERHSRSAVNKIDQLSGPDWYAIFKDLHAGMILDLAGHKKEAGKRLERAYKLDSSALRVVEAYGSWLSRNKSPEPTRSRSSRPSTSRCRAIRWCWRRSTSSRPARSCRRWCKSAQAGAAEALYGLGASLGRRGGEDLGLVYLQLALYLEPHHSLALLSLADLYEAIKKPELALKIYERMPADSPLHRNAAIQMASDLDALNRPEEAQEASRGAAQEASATTSKPSWRSATCCAGTRNSPNAPTSIPRPSHADHASGEVELGDVLLPRHLLRALASVAEGGSRSPAGAQALSPSSRTCSTISAIPGSTRACTSTKAWR